MDITEIGTRLSTRANAVSRNRGVAPDRFSSLPCREQLLAAVGRVAHEDFLALKGLALVLLDDRIAGWVRPSSDLDLHMHGVDIADLRDFLDLAAAEVATVGVHRVRRAQTPLASGRHGRRREGARRHLPRQNTQLRDRRLGWRQALAGHALHRDGVHVAGPAARPDVGVPARGDGGRQTPRRRPIRGRKHAPEGLLRPRSPEPRWPRHAPAGSLHRDDIPQQRPPGPDDATRPPPFQPRVPRR